jgi:hypothetical protein
MYTGENTRQDWTRSAVGYPPIGPPQTYDQRPVYPPENAPPMSDLIPPPTCQREPVIGEQNKAPFVFLKDTDLRYLKRTFQIGLVICISILLSYLLFYAHGVYNRDTGCKLYTTQKLVQYVVGTVNSTSDGYGNLYSKST